VIAANPELVAALSLERACAVLGVNRGRYYRGQAPTPLDPER
jgi:hypothetical protein